MVASSIFVSNPFYVCPGVNLWLGDLGRVEPFLATILNHIFSASPEVELAQHHNSVHRCLQASTHHHLGMLSPGRDLVNSRR
ncbi:hypothetical protein RRG08_004507 [Elysia crispata]|uniref:Uncharacterized protein n=1 Tax=Elysia crispata TaxID=231223 RepID=A0AAE1ECT7_9GAST|nr:hypothetical protein RRG08_004507 [Elysia crispata]